MIYPTHTPLDAHITLDGKPIGGFPSGHIVVLVKTDHSVGATSLCANVGDVWLTFHKHGDIHKEQIFVDINNTSITVALANSGIDVLLFDDLSMVLCTPMCRELIPSLHECAVRHDSLLVFVLEGYNRLDRISYVGESVWRNYASYIIALHDGFRASCIWSPVGCKFENVDWRMEQ